jgi:hypothetical protein
MRPHGRRDKPADIGEDVEERLGRDAKSWRIMVTAIVCDQPAARRCSEPRNAIVSDPA